MLSVILTDESLGHGVYDHILRVLDVQVYLHLVGFDMVAVVRWEERTVRIPAQLGLHAQ